MRRGARRVKLRREYAAPVPRLISVNARPRKVAPGRRSPPLPLVLRGPEVAAQRAAREAEILERDRPYVAQALEWAAQASPGDFARWPDISVVGLQAALAAVLAEGFAAEIQGDRLVLLPEAVEQ
jgi:hypothetical protein